MLDRAEPVHLRLRDTPGVAGLAFDPQVQRLEAALGEVASRGVEVAAETAGGLADPLRQQLGRERGGDASGVSGAKAKAMQRRVNKFATNECVPP